MTNSTLLDLLITKFYASPKEKQKKLLTFMLGNVSNKDGAVNILNGEKLVNLDKNYSEKDFIYIPINISAYPAPHQNYYEENNLIVNDLYIRVQVAHINPITGYTGLTFFTSMTTEETVEVSNYNIPAQQQILLT